MSDYLCKEETQDISIDAKHTSITETETERMRSFSLLDGAAFCTCEQINSIIF